MEAKLDAILSVLEQINDRVSTLEAGKSRKGGAGAAEEEELAPAVEAYDELIAASFTPILTTAAKVGGDIEELAKHFVGAFTESRKIVYLASICKKPADPAFTELVAELSAHIQACNGRSPSAQTGDLWKAIGEAVNCACWFLQPGTVDFVKGAMGSFDFYANRVRRTFKDENADVVTLINEVKAAGTALAPFCKEWFKMGMVWNVNGKDVSEAKPGAAPKAAEAKPEPKAEPKPAAKPAAAPAPSGDFAAELAQARKNTASFKHVTADMKTKNRADRSGKVAATARRVAKKAPLPPAKFEQAPNGRWIVEGQEDNRDGSLKIEVNRENVVFRKCRNSVLIVTGKLNTLSFEDCERCSLVVDDALSGLEINKCKSVEVQVNKVVPTVAIDNTEGVSFYLAGPAQPGIQFVSSCSTAMAVYPLPEGDEDVPELAIPQQFVTKFVDGQLVTVPNEHLG